MLASQMDIIYEEEEGGEEFPKIGFRTKICTDRSKSLQNTRHTRTVLSVYVLVLGSYNRSRLATFPRRLIAVQNI